ncbi:hypothetical protein SAMN05216359_1284 [Roseateles sp. YR242]|uniref:hypothetical protein n=1 Tax=Roseateles sp. YR242 TaxID=1855305 RepID=UPI0008B959F0|nr:hypothetical protein [Roseateles sp. YR242]SEL93337.1 hypothetical protein SAMN05216359_1284 [Roseateles sp. YR242]
MTSKNLVLRTVYIDPEVDDELRNEAFAGRTSKNDLFRKYLRIGMQMARDLSAADSVTSKTADKSKVSPQPKAKTTVVAKAKSSGKVSSARGSGSSTRTRAKKSAAKAGTTQHVTA